MNPDGIATIAPAIAKGAAEIITAIPLADILKRICAPAADLLGVKMKERVERCFEKTVKMTQDAGITPEGVAPKLLIPILQAASLEENEDLHTMWAALLSNAASPEGADLVRPEFIAILKHMSPDEAVMLKWMLDQLPTMAWKADVPHPDFRDAYAKLFGHSKTVGRQVSSADDPRWRTCVGGLEAATLIEKTGKAGADRYGYTLTWYGYEFITTCQPPKPKVHA